MCKEKIELIFIPSCANCNELTNKIDKETGFCDDCLKAQFHWQEEE